MSGARATTAGRWAITPVRVVVSLGLLALLLASTDVRAVISPLRTIGPGDVALVWGVFSLSLLLSAWRWQRILAEQGTSVPLGRLFGAYMTGLFLNNLLPGSVGGDVGRAVQLYGETGRARQAACSTLLDRLCGVMGLAALMLLAAAWAGPELPQGLVGAGVLVTGAGLLAGGAAAWWGCGHGLVAAVLERLPAHRVTHALGSLWSALLPYRRSRALLVAVAISVAIHLIQAGLFYLVAQLLQLEIALRWCLVFVPLAQIAAMVPVSFGGLGVREGALALLFASGGTASADIVAVSLTVHALTASLSVFGGLVLLCTPRRTLHESTPLAPVPPSLLGEDPWKRPTPALP